MLYADRAIVSVAELAGVRRTALGEGLRQFVVFFRFQISAQQQVVRHARQAADTAMARVKRRFDRSQRESPAVGDFQRIFARFFLQ